MSLHKMHDSNGCCCAPLLTRTSDTISDFQKTEDNKINKECKCSPYYSVLEEEVKVNEGVE